MTGIVEYCWRKLRIQFGVGFEDARNGAPFRYDCPAGNLQGQRLYELGRVFGIVAPGTKLKTGRKVTIEALISVEVAFRKGDLI